MKTLGIVANIYQEVNALPGWLEMAYSFADHVSVYHAGPKGAESTDGTMDILRKWKVPVHRGAIDEGFGIVRTAAVRSSPCDFVMLLDADERFYQHAQVLSCQGESTPPDEVNEVLQDYDHRAREAMHSNVENLSRLGAKLTVSIGEVYNQGAWLKDMIQHGDLDAVCTIRRHWHDFSMRRPTQNWHQIPDYQVRIVRNRESIHWDANKRMHEQLIGASNVHMPNQTHGPFFDHFHLFFKQQEMDQRKHDLAIYDAIHEGREVPLS